MHTSQSPSSTDQKTCQLSVPSPEEREELHVEETLEVESSAVHTESNSQSNEVKESVLRRSARTTRTSSTLLFTTRRRDYHPPLELQSEIRRKAIAVSSSTSAPIKSFRHRALKLA